MVVVLLVLLLILVAIGALGFVLKVALAVALGLVIGLTAIAALTWWRIRRALFGSPRDRRRGVGGRPQGQWRQVRGSSTVEVLDNRNDPPA